MMGFFDFIKKRKQENDGDAIFAKIHKFNQAKDLVNKAISYREIGLYDKAIDILNHVLKEFPQYLPAKTILGTTLRAKGDINGAENHFKKIITDHNNDNIYPLIEVYANLGAIYYFNKNNKNVALEYYDLALKQPKPENIDYQPYKIMVSNVHKDLSSLFFHEGDLILAKKHALIRLQCCKDCPQTSKIYGLCLVNEFDQDNNKMKYVTGCVENRTLLEAVDHLKTSLYENNDDYVCMTAIALALYYISNFIFYKNNIDFIEKTNKEYRLMYDKIKIGCESSQEAKKCFDMLNNLTADFNMKLVQSLLLS